MKVFISASILVLLTACSTVAGVGTDIKNAADWTHDQISGSSK
jgi:predicted small secreted protein